MRGLMMDTPLTLVHLLERVAALFPQVGLVSRRPDRGLARCTYADVYQRSRRLAGALRALGLQKGDRVATLAWNHHRHLEAFLGVPAGGYVLHTLNPRLHPSDLAYIMNHAGDRVLLSDDVLLPLLTTLRGQIPVEHVVVWSHGSTVPDGDLDYEQLLTAAPADFAYPEIHENDASGLCYTSGTTGRPKGVLYSHRSTVLHALVAALPDALGISAADRVLPVVPMFHVNAWGLPFSATLVGAAQIFPGPHLDPASLLELLASERVTLTAGVPTVWMALLDYLDQHPGAFDLGSLRSIFVGGAAAPRAMVEGFAMRHGLQIVHAWGMTELSPLGTVSRLRPHHAALPVAEQISHRCTQGTPVPLIEVRAAHDTGLVPADGKSIGELQVRGPWVASRYFENPEAVDRFTPDGWFCTGDMVTINPEGYIQITDRAKDLIKSGGEWISSIDLENALMAHPAVKEAAVIAVPHPKWNERPLAVVVLRDGAQVTPEALREFLAPNFARWWLPDAVVFTDQIPRSGAGKFLKTTLRERYRGGEYPTQPGAQG